MTKKAPKSFNKQKEKEFFDNMIKDKEEYDAFENSTYEEVLKLAKMSNLRPGSMIADIGCGSGAWSIRIAKYGYTVVGIDLSRNMVKSAGKLAKKARLSVLPICGDAEHLPFQNRSYDCVFFGLSLHHVPEILLSLKEASRCLKNSGKVVLFEPNGSNPVRVLSNNIGKLLNRLERNQFSSPTERPLNLKKVIRILEFVGFKVIQILPLYYVTNSEDNSKLFSILITKLRNYLINFAHKTLPKHVGATSFVITAKISSSTAIVVEDAFHSRN